MQQCTDARPNCRSRHREPNGNRRETTRRRSDTIVDLMPDTAEPRRAERIQHEACGQGAGEDARRIGRVLAEASGRRIGDAARCWQNQSAERASPMRDTATRRRSNIDTHGYTPTPKEQSENNNPEHHRQDRLRPTSFRRKPESTVPQPPGKPAGRSITRAHWTARPCHSERSEAQGVHSHATTKT